MTTKELLIEKIEQLPEETLKDVLQYIEKRTYKGRIVIDSKDINKENWPFPPEPNNWASLWEERQ